MKILVCVKQVPDTTEIKIDPVTNTLIRTGVPSIMNPFDAYAVEQALRLKEAAGGTVSVVSMGPPQAMSILTDALAMGADEAHLITDRRFGGSDTLATSYILSCAVRQLGPFDVILCGKQAIDGDTGQVGPEMAEHLGIAQVTYVSQLRPDGDRLEAVREHPDRQEILSVALPAVITVVKGEERPRFETIRGRLKANRQEIGILDREALPVEDEKIGLTGSPTKVKRTFTPERHAECVWVEGESAKDQAKALCQALSRTHVI